MGVKSCVIDTNILIYHLNDKLEQNGREMLAEAMSKISYVSVLTRIELLGWHKHDFDSLNATLRLLKRLEEIALTPKIIETSINLKQQRRIKLPDAVIAATALQLSLPLMTRNVDDFINIAGLQLLNPFDRNFC